MEDRIFPRTEAEKTEFTIAMLMFVNNWIPDNVNSPIFRTMWTLIFMLLLVRPWWNERYGFPYDEETNGSDN